MKHYLVLIKKLLIINHKNLDDALLQEKVTVDTVSEVIARWTGIPIHKLMESEKRKIITS